MRKRAEARLDEFVVAAHKVAERGLVIGASGNLSWRVNDENMLITTTGSWMGRLSRKDVAVCRIKDEATLNGKKPSKEIGFHAGILRERADVNAVLHWQSLWATAIACRNPPLKNFSAIPEVPYYIGAVATVPYRAPGSDQLANAVVSAIRKHELVILRNHGQVVVGTDLDDVIAKAAYFELACQVIIAAGEQVQFLSKDAAAALSREGEAYRAKRGTAGV